jgi:hypothetical protein
LETALGLAPSKIRVAAGRLDDFGMAVTGETHGTCTRTATFTGSNAALTTAPPSNWGRRQVTLLLERVYKTRASLFCHAGKGKKRGNGVWEWWSAGRACLRPHPRFQPSTTPSRHSELAFPPRLARGTRPSQNRVMSLSPREQNWWLATESHRPLLCFRQALSCESFRALLPRGLAPRFPANQASVLRCTTEGKTGGA